MSAPSTLVLTSNAISKDGGVARARDGSILNSDIRSSHICLRKKNRKGRCMGRVGRVGRGVRVGKGRVGGKVGRGRVK